MKDTLGHPIGEGDVVIQCANEWGLQAYRVRRDPEETARLHVTHLWDYAGINKALAKTPVNFINISAIFGDAFEDAEIERRLTELHGE